MYKYLIKKLLPTTILKQIRVLRKSINDRAQRMKSRDHWRDEQMKCIREIGTTPGFKIVSQDKELTTIKTPFSDIPIKLRTYSSDPYIFKEIFLEKEYDLALKNKPNLIVDVGANVGYASIFFACKYPEAEIIAVEPEQGNFAILKRNIEPYSNIQAIKSGVWSKSGYLKIENPQDAECAFQFKYTEESTGNIKCLTIGDILNTSNYNYIDLLKIDIEGAEKELFSQNTEWLKDVGALNIELHDRFKPGCKESFLSAINQYGFTGHEDGLNYIAFSKVL